MHNLNDSLVVFLFGGENMIDIKDIKLSCWYPVKKKRIPIVKQKINEIWGSPHALIFLSFNSKTL